MIRYIALREASIGEARGYDICACDGEDDLMEVIVKARGVVPDSESARSILAALNSADVDPLHMEDIIEDILYEMAL